MVQQILAVRDDALYVTLQLPQPQLAVGRTEMPKLPSSRIAIIANPIHTQASVYRNIVTKTVPMDLATAGNRSFAITVDHTLNKQ